ncbi:MAG TPA: hypothetical protein PKD90_01975 [Phnomibacter sp.]|nr:hypothetical protein [Phnomibacter sp.]
MEKGDAIYLHRIVVNQTTKGIKIFPHVLAWAIRIAWKQGLRYIRMDTWANNNKLIRYYESYGFKPIENYTTPNTPALPQQHRKLTVMLLEFTIPVYNAKKNRVYGKEECQ